MSKSIIPDNDEYCYICKMQGIDGIKGTDKHHMVFGTSRRVLAEKDGLHCQLCHSHHMRLHQQGDYKEELQQLAEKTWLEHYNKKIEDWIKRYGKNYL